MEKINLENYQSGVADLENLNQRIEDSRNEEEKNELFIETEKIEENLDLLENELGLDREELVKMYSKISPIEAYTEIVESNGAEIADNIKSGQTSKVISGWKELKISAGKKLRLAACFLALVATGALTPNYGEAKEPEKVGSQEKMHETLSDMKKWRADWKAEDIFSDEDLAARAKIYSSRPDKAYEIMEKIVRQRRLHEAAKEKAIKDGTYKKVKDQDGNIREIYSTEGLKWDYRNKNWTADKLSNAKKEIGLTEKSGKENFKEEDYFTARGEAEFLRILELKFGKAAPEVFRYNMKILDQEINKYVKGELGRNQFIDLMRENNINIRKMGAEFDVFDIEKIIENIKENTVIKSGAGADQDVW